MSAGWAGWVGRSLDGEDEIAPGPALRLAATLGDLAAPHDLDPGAALPPLWHWLYFLEATPRASLGPDGHALRGAFLPPIELPRRMYAGGRLSFPGALRLGRKATRRSTVAAVTEKTGRSGPLAFVTIRHEIAQDGNAAIVEEHDIVYREAAATPLTAYTASAEVGASAPALWTETVAPDPVLLFRYSALTFNGHRIHYDRRHATETEGYPGLVVHAPLTALLLAEAIARHHPEARVAGVEFRAMAPLFDDAPFALAEVASDAPGTLACEARTPDGRVAMRAVVRTGG